ncbi:MAG TPA: hypothetical protein DF383_05440, partial [Deltaproteobacteria bacterium]|nr:hypothetical protein [Deltaproteobacteria bacterium]
MSFFSAFGRKIIFVSVLFVLGSPFFIVMLKPQDHLLYHLQKKNLVSLSSADFTGKIQDNLYAEVEGVIDPDSFYFEQKLLGGDLSFVFGLKGYPKNFLLHLRKGDFFYDLAEANRKSKRGETPEEREALI